MIKLHWVRPTAICNVHAAGETDDCGCASLSKSLQHQSGDQITAYVYVAIEKICQTRVADPDMLSGRSVTFANP
jgi:hypothetical protein